MLFKGTVAQDFLASVFSMDLLYMGPNFEAKRILIFFSFSRSYSKFAIDPRSRLLRGMKICFLRIQKLMVKFNRY